MRPGLPFSLFRFHFSGFVTRSRLPRRPVMTLPIVTLLAAVAVTACSRPEAPSPPVATPAPVSLDQFQTLHWLEGTWRGTGPGVTPFYESYRYLNDSTIRSFSYPDSTFAEARDSGTIAWRSGQVTSGDSGFSWVA